MAPQVVAHWATMLDGLEGLSAKQFYAGLSDAISKRRMSRCTIETVALSEGGILSRKRDYLRIRRGDVRFDVCAAPFAGGFFVSWWLIEDPGWLGLVYQIPLLGAVVRHFFTRITYYHLDTRDMFLEAVKHSVLEVIDAQTKAQGLRELTALERVPEMREFFKTSRR